jgi:tetratricopeptide (TPR) repeat protein
VGRNVANELICSVLLRGAQMRFEEAKKADFAYSSVDDKYAKSKANEQIRIMMSYAEAAMRLPINNPTLQCEVASSVIQGIKFYSGESPYSELLNKATSVILGFKETNLTLFNKYAGLLKAPSRKNQGCMSLFATSSDKKRPLIGKPVKILLITVGSLLALLIIAALISEKHTQEAVTYYQRGVAYYEKGNPDEAISNFNKAIEIDPNTTDAYGFRGVIFREKGNFDQAILDISKAIENNSNPAPQLYYNRGIAYREKGNFEQAILDFNRTIEKDPGFSDAYVSRGFVHYKKGNLEQAISDLDKAIEINPKDAKVYVSRGVFHSEKGNFDQAILDCNKAIKINSKYAPAYYNRGIAYREKGNLDKAISDFSKAIEIDSTFANAYYHLGKVYFMKKNYSKSWDNIHKAEELGCKIISPEFLIDLKNASGRER